jgi:hypothetical protein
MLRNLARKVDENVCIRRETGNGARDVFVDFVHFLTTTTTEEP